MFQGRAGRVFESLAVTINMELSRIAITRNIVVIKEFISWRFIFSRSSERGHLWSSDRIKVGNKISKMKFRSNTVSGALTSMKRK